MPDPHILQSWEWGEVKSQFGWKPILKIWESVKEEGSSPANTTTAAALVLERVVSIGRLASPLRVLYVPKGPMMDWRDEDLRGRVLFDLGVLAHKRGAIFIKIDPDVPVGRGIPGSPEAVENPLGEAVSSDLIRRGWRFSREQVQFRNSVIVDLDLSEEELLQRMKPKMRYNIRLAERRGVSVRSGSEADIALLYRMYAETSIRDGFAIREESYYRCVWQTFMQKGLAVPLIAEVEGQPVAALIVFQFAGKAWYMYGMSREIHREKMASHLLQYEAMRKAKAAGCRHYDLWGAPDEFDESDSMWGVFRFKAGLGGQVVRTLGAWDLPVQPMLYRLYTQTLPRILDVMRWRGTSRTRGQMNAENIEQ